MNFAEVIIRVSCYFSFANFENDFNNYPLHIEVSSDNFGKFIFIFATYYLIKELNSYFRFTTDFCVYPLPFPVLLLYLHIGSIIHYIFSILCFRKQKYSRILVYVYLQNTDLIINCKISIT